MRKPYLIYLYAFLSAVFGAGVALSFYGYSYAGYYSDKIIGWIWLLLSLVMAIRFWKKRLTKIAAGSVAVLLLLSLAPMMIPFYSSLSWFTTINHRQHIMLNSQYRIERARRGPLGMEEVIVFKRMGILEQAVSITPWYDIPEKVMHPLPEFFFKANPDIEKASMYSVSRDSICIVYTIDGETGVLCHPLKNR